MSKTKPAKDLADENGEPVLTMDGNVTVYPNSWTKEQVANYAKEQEERREEYNKWLLGGS